MTPSRERLTVRARSDVITVTVEGALDESITDALVTVVEGAIAAGSTPEIDLPSGATITGAAAQLLARCASRGAVLRFNARPALRTGANSPDSRGPLGEGARA
jgi:hypothetical protein